MRALPDSPAAAPATAPTATALTAPVERERPAWGERLAWVLLLFGLPLLLCWPLPQVFTTHVLAAADQEAAPHIWGLWAALKTGSPLLLDTRLLAWPEGIEVVLVDPANLGFFALGSLFGPAAGYNTTLYAGFVLMGLAGRMLAQESGGDPFIGALVGLCCPALLSNAADGQTEGFAVGLVGIQLALLLRFLREGGVGRGALAALGLALAAWSGPYNGVWAALIDLGVGLSLPLRAGAPIRLRRAAAVALGAGLLVLPLGRAIFQERAGHLPGAGGRDAWRVIEDPAIFRGGVQTGADLLDPWLPGVLTGGEAEISHTVYLGVFTLILAGLGLWRRPGLWPYLVGAAAFTLLSFGPVLYLGGRALRSGELTWVGPVSLLAPALPVLYRITRWYRAAAVARLLLIPLAAAGRWGGRGRLLIGGALLIDCLALAPLAWPLHHSPLPEAAAYAEMTRPDAVLVLPLSTSATPPPGAWRDREVLAQTLHGHPIAATMMGFPPASAARAGQVRVQALMRTGALPAADRAALQRDGFGYLALLPDYQPLPAAAWAALEACLGAPLARGEGVVIFDLHGGPTGDCAAAQR